MISAASAIAFATLAVVSAFRATRACSSAAIAVRSAEMADCEAADACLAWAEADKRTGFLILLAEPFRGD